jgi:hypothetical protein
MPPPQDGIPGEPATSQRQNRRVMMKIDAAVNIFAKPYQTARSILTLLQHSGRHIDKIYMQFDGPNPAEQISIQPLSIST